jgi:hypothetical protein
MVRRCRLKRVKTRVESAWSQRLRLKYDEPLSKNAFNLNLRRYTTAAMRGNLAAMKAARAHDCPWDEAGILKRDRETLPHV